MLTLKYLDKVSYIRGGGTRRGGKVPDTLRTVFFLRKEDDDTFSFVYTDGDEVDKAVGYASFKSIVFVNDEVPST